jgi:hypothetical protein
MVQQITSLICGVTKLHQHDPPHRPIGDALDACHQFHLASPAAATIVAHVRHIGPLHPLPATGAVSICQIPMPTR